MNSAPNDMLLYWLSNNYFLFWQNQFKILTSISSPWKEKKDTCFGLEVVHCICLISVGRRIVLQGFKMIYSGMPFTVATGIELELTLHPQLQVKKLLKRVENLTCIEMLCSIVFNCYRNVTLTSCPVWMILLHAVEASLLNCNSKRFNWIYIKFLWSPVSMQNLSCLQLNSNSWSLWI